MRGRDQPCGARGLPRAGAAGAAAEGAPRRLSSLLQRYRGASPLLPCVFQRGTHGVKSDAVRTGQQRGKHRTFALDSRGSVPDVYNLAKEFPQRGEPSGSIPCFRVSTAAGAALQPIPGGCPIPDPIPGHKHAQTGPAVAKHFPQRQVPAPAVPGTAEGAAGAGMGAGHRRVQEAQGDGAEVTETGRDRPESPRAAMHRAQEEQEKQGY